MKAVMLTGRILYSIIFLMTIRSHFSDPAINYASVNGVPFSSVLVPLSGILAFIGALSIILGYKAKLGAWLIVIFLIPVTIFMHAFWKETNPIQYQMQIGMFLKNLSMLGAALMITYLGSGPLSMDSQHEKLTNVKHEIENYIDA